MRITGKEYAISGMCWRKEVGFSQNLFISMGIVPVPCAAIDFDLLQNISFFPKLCIFVNDLIYRSRRGLDILTMEIF